MPSGPSGTRGPRCYNRRVMNQHPAVGTGRHALRAGHGAEAAVLALDLGASRIRGALVGTDGRVVQRAEAETPREPTASSVSQACVDVLGRARDAALRAGAAAPVAVGISAVGPLDPARGVIVDPPNMGPQFRDVALASIVAERIGLPTVLDRDTNVAALGEQGFGAGRGVDDFLYLTVSTGLGGAIVRDGVLVHGPDGTAGELGHLPIDIDGPLCGCGARGHLEAISSGGGIARAAREAVQLGRSPALAGVAARVGLARLSAADVAHAEDHGDPEAARIMAYARRAFAEALIALVDLFNPTRIIVGGSVARTQGERWLQPARDAVRDRAFRLPARRVEIVAAALGDDVGLIGAVPLVRSRLGLPAPQRDPPGLRQARPQPRSQHGSRPSGVPREPADAAV